jgi:hypothetical protein
MLKAFSGNGLVAVALTTQPIFLFAAYRPVLEKIV